MKRLLLALALLLAPSGAFAQCSGNFPANSACATVAGGLPGPLPFTAIGARERLTAARTYYYRSDGSDSNNGLTNTAGGAWLTNAHALDVITKTLDFGGQTVTLLNGNGFTDTNEVFVNNPWVGGGIFVYDGGGGAVRVTGLHKAFLAYIVQPGGIVVQNVTLASDTFSCIQNAGYGVVNVGVNVIFDGCNEYDLEAANYGAVVAAAGATYTVHGSTVTQVGHLGANNGGTIIIAAATINYTSGAQYATAMAVAVDGGYIAGTPTINLNGHTVTGTRFSVTVAGIINTIGCGITCFPGTLPGVIDNTGTYDNSVAKGHGDSDYQMLPSDWYVYTTATLTAPRTWTLPLASTVPAGVAIRIVDAFDGVTSTNTITVARNGSDTIDNVPINFPISNAGGGMVFVSDGVSNWGFPVQSPSTGGTGRPTLAAHTVVIGNGTSPVTLVGPCATGTFLGGNTSADPSCQSVSISTNVIFAMGTGAGGCGTIPPNTNAAYTSAFGCWQGTEANEQTPVSIAFLAKNFYANANTAPVGGQTYTMTIRKNGGATGVTCQMTGSATTCNDTTHSVSFSAGDLIDLQIITSATAATVTAVNTTFTAVTTSP